MNSINNRYDIIIIGGGPAGLAAAHAAWKQGAKEILIIERDTELGGILNQCIHNGFGLHYFGQELTGPEYAGRFIKLLDQTNVHIMLDTMVLEITNHRQVHAVNKDDGYMILHAGAIILAMGCRERTRGAIAIPGDRPAGVFTAGTAQRYINIEGYMVGKRVVILGSGDIGLIMARRMTLEGAKVLACIEIMPYSNGLTRNIVQCLDDYDIPLYLSHTITSINGKGRVESIVVSQVDKNRKPIEGTETMIECDTVLLSVGLIPENELSKAAGIELDKVTGGPVVYENMETSVAGVFACGNAVQVHDLADYVTLESQRAGRAAADFASGKVISDQKVINLRGGGSVTYTVPQRIRLGGCEEKIPVMFRVNCVYHDAEITVTQNEDVIARYKRTHMTPGEMEQISIPKGLISDSLGDITVSCQGGDNK